MGYGVKKLPKESETVSDKIRELRGRWTANLRQNATCLKIARLEAQNSVLSGERRGRHKLTASRMRLNDKHSNEKFTRNMRIIRSENMRITLAKKTRKSHD